MRNIGIVCHCCEAEESKRTPGEATRATAVHAYELVAAHTDDAESSEPVITSPKRPGRGGKRGRRQAPAQRECGR